MRKIARCLLGVLAVAPCQPHSRQVIPFKDALNCVPALHNLNIMAQYCSQNPKRIVYMAEYLNWFHQMKDTVLEIGVSNRTRAKVDKWQKDQQHQRAQRNMRVVPSSRGRRLTADWNGGNDPRIHLIYAESHFNFVKIGLLSHSCDHIYQFGNITRYPTVFGELDNKKQMQD